MKRFEAEVRVRVIVELPDDALECGDDYRFTWAGGDAPECRAALGVFDCDNDKAYYPQEITDNYEVEILEELEDEDE